MFLINIFLNCKTFYPNILTRYFNIKYKSRSFYRLQEEMALIHKERGAIDRWVVDIGEMFNNIVSLKSRDVHIKGITDMVQLPDDADQNTVLQYIHKLMGQIFSILP